MRYLSIFLFALSASGCYNLNSPSLSTRYHEDGRAKPIAAIPAIIDTTSFDASWSVSEELTSAVVQMISKSGKIFVQSQDDFAIAADPFMEDLAWVKREFQNQEFAVFLELAEHEFTPSSKQTLEPGIANNLHMGIRVRVVDLRGVEPKIVLQEMVRTTYYIPKTLLPFNYHMFVWGTADYEKSPIGIAHRQIAERVVERVSDYILLAKSR
jgi:hypothetical protein